MGPEKIKPKTIRFGVNKGQQLFFQDHPLSRIDQALKDRMLHSLAKVLAGF
jgi:hypothetical protein